MGLMKIFDNLSIKKPKENIINENRTGTEKEIVNYYVKDLAETIWSGDKFPGSFGLTKDYSYVDYYTLRKRSVQLFKEDNYARGLIRRLITNEIYKGINLESNPISQMLNMTEDQAIEWAENVEIKWELWGKDPFICDYNKIKNIGQIQSDIRQTALISGDCLVILRINKITNLPSIEVIDGSHIQTPIGVEIRKGNTVKYGIEFNQQKRQVAYWVYTEKKQGIGFEWKRIPAFGEKTGRRNAWLVYGTDKMLDECRGEPILANMLYMLKELDRYRDAEVRAATVNALLPMFMKRTEKSVSSPVFGQGAVKRTSTTLIDGEAETQNYNVSSNLPGMTLDQLPYGVEPVSFQTNRPNINFGKFEDIILNTIAWSIEMPPELLKQKFDSNFSASRQANNEFQIYINKRAWIMGTTCLQHIYEEWLISNIINNKVEAPGLLEAWINNDWEIYNAWLNAEWTGLSRPSVDGLKDANTSEKLLALGLSTFDVEARKNTGIKWRTLVQKLRREKDYMEKLGIVSSIDENSMGEPVQTNQENNNNVQNKLLEMLNNINERLDYLEEK